MPTETTPLESIRQLLRGLLRDGSQCAAFYRLHDQNLLAVAESSLIAQPGLDSGALPV